MLAGFMGHGPVSPPTLFLILNMELPYVPNSTIRTPATDMLYNTANVQAHNLLYNKFTTNGQKFASSQHLDMSRCWALALRCGEFVVQQVVELL